MPNRNLIMDTNQALLLLLPVVIIASASESIPSHNKTDDKSNSSDLNPAETAFYNSYVNQGNFPGSYSYSSKDQYNSRFPSIVDRNSSVCGIVFTGQCQPSRYRTYDGTCNNLQIPTWGSTNTRYSRLVPHIYSDGLHAPPISVTNNPLPSTRKISFALFPHNLPTDVVWTLATMQWGQLVAHDMGSIGLPVPNGESSPACCTGEGQYTNSTFTPECYPILIAPEDPVFGAAGYRCLSFDRSQTDVDFQCNSGDRPAEQVNTVTHFLDGSVTYGSTEEKALELRTKVAGRMRVDFRNNREWPPQIANKTTYCDIDFEEEVCYDMGDTRSNQSPQLTILQIIMVREHNRIAGELSKINRHWDDETLYQESRRIVVAELQHISYYEYLPAIIGRFNAYHYKILHKTKDYVNDYDRSVDPSIINEHTTAANRHFHTAIAGFLKLFDKQSKDAGDIRISNWFSKPMVLEQRDNFDGLVRGLVFQPEAAVDRFFNEEITSFLFRRRRVVGTDLRAKDIQRNRDHGLGTYNDLREYCGLHRAKTWAEFAPLIPPHNIEELAAIYESPDDVDLTVGGTLELIVPGTLVGPTFLCILIEQYYRTRVGDRYWFETGDPDISFTREQLAEIRKSSISRLLCDNGDDITHIQRRGFRQVGSSNPITSCRDIPKVNLKWWKDYALVNDDKFDGKPSYWK